MVYVQIHAGLGNQLFQFHFGELLSSWGLRVKYTWEYPEMSGRQYKLNEIGYQLQRYPYGLLNFRRGTICRILSLGRLTLGVIRDEDLENLSQRETISLLKSGDFLLKGYWAFGMKYSSCVLLPKPQYKFNHIVDEEIDKVITLIKNTNSIFLHVRSGDYLSAKNIAVFSHLDDNYYYRAIDLLNKKTSNPVFFIFTDEPLRTNSRSFVKPDMFIVSNIIKSDVLEFYLMMLCKHSVCANSTFSYWAAAFNITEKKIVIQPTKWFNDSEMQKKTFANAKFKS